MRELLYIEFMYHTETEKELVDYQLKLLELLEKANRHQDQDRIRDELTDELFEMLRLSRAASANSKVVNFWRNAEKSAERTEAAMKWARIAANVAEQDASEHAIWKQDHERAMSRPCFFAWFRGP